MERFPFIYLIISLFLITEINAQDLNHVKLTKSETFEDIKKNTTLAFAEKDDEGNLITVRSYGSVLTGIQGYYIDSFDTELRLKDSYDLKMKLLSKTPGIVRGLFIKDGVVNILCLKVKKGKDKKIFSYSVFSSKLKKLDFQEKEILSFKEGTVSMQSFGDTVIRSNFSDRNLGPIGQVGFSENKNYFGIHQTVYLEKTRKSMVYVFDANLNLLYENNMSTLVNENVYSYQDFSIDDQDASIYYLVKSFEGQEGKKRVSLNKDYHYQIIKASKDKENVAINLAIEGIFVPSLVTINKHGKLSCVGFYSDENENLTKGVVRFNIDPHSFTLTQNTTVPFSEQFLIDKYGKVKDKELKFTAFKSVFMTENGDVILNGEETYKSVKLVNGFSETQNFFKDDILTIKISEDGSLIWARNINKRQRTDGSQLDYVSYTSTVSKGTVYFILNAGENVQRLSKKRISFPKVTKKLTNLYVIAIHPDGTISYEKKLDNKASLLAYKTAQGIISKDESEILLEGSYKKNKGLVRISF